MVVVLLQGHMNLEPVGRRGYHVPKRGTVQVVSSMFQRLPHHCHRIRVQYPAFMLSWLPCCHSIDGVFQTLFNPNKAVVKMFVVMYDLSDMPPNCQTFLRQRTLYMPVKGSPSDVQDAPVYLRYLIHLR